MQTKRIALAACAAATLAWAGVATPASAKVYKWGTFTPPQSEVPRMVMKMFNDEVKAKTNGAVEFKLYTGGSLVGPRDTLSGIRDGIVDGGFIVPAFVVSSLPNQNMISDSASFVSDAVTAAGAAAQTMMLDCPECQGDFHKMGSITLGGMGLNAYIIQCGKPVNAIEDFKGLKIRVAISASGRWVQHLGAVPVGGMPPTDIVTAMQRGQIDCAVALPSWLYTFSLADSVKHIVTMPQGNAHGTSGLVFSLRLWDSLSRDQKQVLLHAAPKAIAHATIETEYVTPKTKLEPVIKKHHITEWKGDAKLRASWTEFMKGEKEATIGIAVKRGIDKAVATRVIEKHIANAAKWKKIADEVGSDEKKFADALWKEIYSKVDY